MGKDRDIEIAWNVWNFLFKGICNKAEESPESPEKQNILSYIGEIKNLPEDTPENNLYKELFLTYKYFVKPYLSWNQINESLNKIKLASCEKEYLIYKLKPIPFEAFVSTAIAEINKIPQKIYDYNNQQLKQLSPLIGRLDKLQKQEIYRNYQPLNEVINKLNNDLATRRTIVKLGKFLEKNTRRKLGVDKNLNKISPQKHGYWNAIVSAGVKILNYYYHNDSCERPCRKTHQKTLEKIAELLKLLYPTIWSEDIETITNRIKQKDYRRIPS